MTARVAKEGQRPPINGALDPCRLRHVSHVEPRDVTEARMRRMPDDVGPLARESTPGQRASNHTAGEDTRARDPAHSGRCCRRNCSISATSSEAGGRSLPRPGSADGSSVSRDSSFLT